MVDLYFQNIYGQSKFIKTCEESDVLMYINDFIANCNIKNKENGVKEFKSFYIRTWEENDAVWYDVGSHSEFFYTKKHT